MAKSLLFDQMEFLLQDRIDLRTRPLPAEALALIAAATARRANIEVHCCCYAACHAIVRKLCCWLLSEMLKSPISLCCAIRVHICLNPRGPAGKKGRNVDVVPLVPLGALVALEEAGEEQEEVTTICGRRCKFYIL